MLCSSPFHGYIDGYQIASFDVLGSTMESCQIDAGKPSVRSLFAGSKPLPGADGRSRFAKRFRAVTESLARELRNGEALSIAETALIRQAGHLICQAEAMQSAAARGEAIDPDGLVRVSNAALRILSKLDRSQGKSTAVRPLRERLLAERGPQ
jgi:hypothetical protein